ncbi:GntR family transcriptional regulator [Sanguibacter sp. HDW7]|uniref:GntR family transcriptional regulator n=1 Tax=Sanguibacter sp. HDW7 TaxID=2714931 RepID=UPI00140C2F10|nr:GntR family transcriptional regulator [Sanguibacter sp. HDW7]QIK82226.1 GntR family transcriptional regulator [Sanguibacter sp. HDW7]
MLLTLDPAAPEPLFEQLAAQLRAAIAAGELSAGDRLAPARDVAASLDINLHTVLRAYQELRDEGLVELRRGRGATVAARLDDDALRAAITTLVAESRRLGLDPRTTTALVKEALR